MYVSIDRGERVQAPLHLTMLFILRHSGLVHRPTIIAIMFCPTVEFCSIVTSTSSSSSSSNDSNADLDAHRQPQSTAHPSCSALEDRQPPPETTQEQLSAAKQARDAECQEALARIKRKESIFDAGRTLAAPRRKRTLAELEIAHRHWAREERLILTGLTEAEKELRKRKRPSVEVAGQDSQVSVANLTNENASGTGESELEAESIMPPSTTELEEVEFCLRCCLVSAQKHAEGKKRKAARTRLKERLEQENRGRSERPPGQG
jgi:hypothetical protein